MEGANIKLASVASQIDGVSARAMLDELAAVPGVRGVMLTFDDFVIGMEQFGTRILPLMQCRADVRRAA